MGPHRWGGGYQTQQPWTCTGDQAGHYWQRGATSKRPALGQLICTQGPSLQEPPLPPQRRFELSFVFFCSCLSLSRSELEQGWEQRHVSPIQSLCARRGPKRGGLGSSKAWPQARQGWRCRNSCPAVHGDPCSAGTSYGRPRGPVPSQGWGLSQSPSSSAKGISWDQRSFWRKLPLKLRVGLQAQSGDNQLGLHSWAPGYGSDSGEDADLAPSLCSTPTAQ